MENCYSVVKIEYCSCRLVTAVRHGETVRIAGSLFQTVPHIKIPAELVVQESISKKERMYKSTLTFTSDKFDVDKTKNYAYRISLADGTKLLMGESRKPFPITTKSRTMGSATSNQLYIYKVVLQDIVALPTIVE